MLWMILAAWANPNDDRAKTLFQVGRESFAEGRFEEAINNWEDAYELSPRPLIQFNLAEAYERVGRFKDALVALQTYKPSAELDEIDRIDARIASLETRVSLQEREAAAAEAERLAREAQLEAERRKADELERRVAEAESKPPSLVPPLVVTGTGVAMIGVGVGTGLAALGTRGQISDLCTADNLCKDDASPLVAKQRSQALVSDITTFGGIAVTGLGTAWLIRQLGKRGRKK